jgi:isopenicillin N synthase-like dioxygenase
VEEKLKHRADLENGIYNGYRPEGSIELFPGIKDNIEMYNIFKFNSLTDRSHPDIIKANMPEIERIHRFIHGSIIRKLLTLIAIILELPEDHFVNTHTYNGNSDCHLRYQLYRARTPEQNAAAQNIYSRGHTDFGSLTLLFRQPVAALQILSPDGTWKYVKPHPGSITVNIADALQFWSSGYLKSSVHRVVAPPADQAHIDRLGVLFFLRPEAGLDLKPVSSPLLKRLGLQNSDEEEAVEGIKAGDWVRARVQGNWNAPPEEGQKEKVVLGKAKTKIYD